MDPRDEVSDSNQLTEDSDDELADLQKEYELKRQRLLEKKQRKDVPRSPTKPKPHALPQIQKPREYVPPKQPKASVFGTAFVKTATVTKKQVVLEDRLLSFDNVPKPLNEVVDEKDPLSGQHLQRRFQTADTITQLTEKVKILRVDKLLAKVVKPRYEEPAYDNWALVGMVMYKSPPLMTAVSERSAPRKYMRMLIGNFERKVDVMLFGDAFEKWWKLRVGEVVMVLNPEISRFSGTFALRLTDNLNTVLEIGLARDLGVCEARKADETRCKVVVNLQKSRLCEFHEQKKYVQGLRMELNGSVGLRRSTKPVLAERANEITKAYAMNVGNWKVDDEYTDPKALDTKSRRRKLDETKTNQKLEQKLMQLDHSLGLAKTLGLVKKTQNASSELAFSSSLLNKIGFDPTTNSKRKRDVSADLRELYDISSSKKNHRKLDPSTEDKRQKRSVWQSTWTKVKKYEKTVHNPAAGTAVSETAYSDADSYEDMTSPGDSEDDLEIDYGTKANVIAYGRLTAKENSCE